MEHFLCTINKNLSYVTSKRFFLFFLYNSEMRFKPITSCKLPKNHIQGFKQWSTTMILAKKSMFL